MNKTHVRFPVQDGFDHLGHIGTIRRTDKVCFAKELLFRAEARLRKDFTHADLVALEALRRQRG